MFTNRIRELRTTAALSQAALAKRAGTSPQQVDRLEKGDRKLTLDWVEKLARALDVEPLALIQQEVPTSRIRAVPLIGHVSCGQWEEAVEIAHETVMAVDVSPLAFALRPDGDSMDRIVAPGGYIVVDPTQLDLVPGKAYVIMKEDGEATAKVYRAEPPSFEPCSTNPEHTILKVGREPFRIIGRITFAAKMV
ncbi:helix-turn-helix domain-containing protein [Pacificimonas sp. WHA3]|uniref:Helix-turn-helix domain-containing protein n=1 Tax=Pacificimonas pallii TaxID=2827236 RepID=A0ABS6SF39_9SPHN|nr:LexA family transcriptional regulator [Pacificimonas pallii]MBV7256875.1 helix-turn-helix domain-containing protein [Pacificimonas pallii]